MLYEERIVKANKDFKCTLDACPVEVFLENITNAMPILTSQLNTPLTTQQVHDVFNHLKALSSLLSLAYLYFQGSYGYLTV